MAVTVYLFDAGKRLKRPIRGVSELIHIEQDYALNAAISARYGAECGEHLGFMCVDGRFRLFQIDVAEKDDETGQIIIEATDAAVAELADTVTVDVRTEETTAEQAFEALLLNTDFELGAVTATERTGKVDAYYTETWAALQKARQTFNARLEPYYLFSNGRITGKRLDVLKKEAVFRGRIFSAGTDASGVTIVQRGSPKTVLYPAGAATGTTSNPDRVTIADVVWSKANGDPADKPAGQLWVEDEAATAIYGRREGPYVDQNIQDAEELLQDAWDELQRKKQPTVTGTATAQELEMAQGHEHKMVRLWDLVAVEDSALQKAIAQVIGIRRNYIRWWLTKFELGDEKEDPKDITRQMAAANQEIETLKRGGAGGSNKAEENKAFIVENMEQIRLHTVSIEDQGKKINQTEIRMQDAEINIIATQNKLSYLEDGVSAVTDRVSTVEINLDAANSEIQLRAKQTELERVEGETQVLSKEISEAEIRISAAEAEIMLKASQESLNDMNQRVDYAEAQIAVNAGNILLMASKEEVKDLEDSLSYAFIEINALDGEITSKVSKNGVISAINQSAEEITIQASKINLNGYVTTSHLNAEIAALEGMLADVISTITISAQNAYIDNLYIGNRICEWKGTYVQYGLPDFLTTNITLANGNSVKVVTGWADAPSSYRRYINYIGEA